MKKDKEISTRKGYKTLLTITYVITGINVLMLIAGSWWGLMVLIAGPFELLALGVVWILYSAYPTYSAKMPPKHSKKKPVVSPKTIALSRIGIVIALLGPLLTMWLIHVGSPNTGIGQQLLGLDQYRYLDMQVSAVLVIIGIAMVFIARTIDINKT